MLKLLYDAKFDLSTIVVKKTVTLLLFVTLPNLNQFSKFIALLDSLVNLQ